MVVRLDMAVAALEAAMEIVQQPGHASREAALAVLRMALALDVLRDARDLCQEGRLA